MAKFELIGTQEKLSKGPKNAMPTNTSGGTYQMVGDSVPLSQKPVPMQNSSSPGGTFQNVGEKITMSATPHKGWASASTPLSDRAKVQSGEPK